MGEDIIQAINGLNHLCALLPAPSYAVIAAEQALGLHFAADYKAYVQHFGAISACGIELTGVTTSRRFDVVAVTKKSRAMYGSIPPYMYVIEDTAANGSVILQDATGAVYSISLREPIHKIFDSLTAYVKTVRA